MSLGHAAVRHPPAAVDQRDAAVLGVGIQARAATLAKGQRPIELIARQTDIGTGGADLFDSEPPG